MSNTQLHGVHQHACHLEDAVGRLKGELEYSIRCGQPLTIGPKMTLQHCIDTVRRYLYETERALARIDTVKESDLG